MTTVSNEDECPRQGECIHQSLAGKVEPMTGTSVAGTAYKEFTTNWELKTTLRMMTQPKISSNEKLLTSSLKAREKKTRQQTKSTEYKISRKDLRISRKELRSWRKGLSAGAAPVWKCNQHYQDTIWGREEKKYSGFSPFPIHSSLPKASHWPVVLCNTSCKESWEMWFAHIIPS